MPNPWEVAQPAAVKTSGNPWDVHPADQAALPSAPSKIVQEMPAGVSFADRFKVANLANSPESAMTWLREQYPNYEVGLVGTQIAMKPKGSSEAYKALIPQVEISDVWKNPKKVLERATDLTSDLASGIASGGAAALAAGATALSGPGALAAGAAAGGAANAGAEALRQQLGKALGINKELSPEQIATSGALGAAGTLAFGAGAAKGLVGKGYDVAAKKVFPKIGEIVSGVPAKTITNAANRMPEIKNLESQGVLDFAEKAHEDIASNLMQAKQKIGQNIQSSIENAGGNIDVAEAKKPFEDLLTKLKTQYGDLKTPELKGKIKDVEDQLKYYFSRDPVVDPQTGQMVLDSFGAPVTEVMSMTPTQAFGLKQSMADLGELAKVRDSSIKSSLSGMSPAQKEIANAARQSKNALDKGISAAVDQADTATGGLQNLKSQYRDLSNLQDYLEPHFRTPEKTYNTMRNMGGKNKEALLQTMKQTDEKYGTNMLDNAQMLDAYNYFGNPSFNPLSTKGSTSTGRAVPLAGLGAAIGGTLSHKAGGGYMPGLVLGGGAGAALGSPAALRGYMAVGRGIRGAGNAFGEMTPAAGQFGLNVMQDNMNPQSMSPWTLFPPQGATP